MELFFISAVDHLQNRRLAAATTATTRISDSWSKRRKEKKTERQKQKERRKRRGKERRKRRKRRKKRSDEIRKATGKRRRKFSADFVKAGKSIGEFAVVKRFRVVEKVVDYVQKFC